MSMLTLFPINQFSNCELFFYYKFSFKTIKAQKLNVGEQVSFDAFFAPIVFLQNFLQFKVMKFIKSVVILTLKSSSQNHLTPIHQKIKLSAVSSFVLGPLLRVFYPMK